MCVANSDCEIDALSTSLFSYEEILPDVVGFVCQRQWSQNETE